MIPVKKSIQPFPFFIGILTERLRPIAKALPIALCCLLLAQPVLAAPVNRQPPNQVIGAVRQDAGQRTQIPKERWKVTSANPRTWPDGCLGLPNPEELCTQSLIEGWEIVLTDDRQTLTYRTDSTGRNVRLEPKK